MRDTPRFALAVVVRGVVAAFVAGSCSSPPAPPPRMPEPVPVAPAPAATPPGVSAPKVSTVVEIQKDAHHLEPFVRTDLARAFLAATADLPPQASRKLWHTADKSHYYNETQLARLGEAERRALTEKVIDEEYYYVARWGTPVAYARPLDLLGLGKDGFAGKKVLDFGFGQVGQLRMMASLGARVTGIDVDPVGAALLTQPGDQGPVHGRLGPDGDVRLLYGHFPAEAGIKEAAGGGYDLFLSKNVLKRGYIHPERPADEKRLIQLGVDDETFVRTLFGMLVPGGRALIYNLAPAPAPLDKPYIPWADGRCPFARALWEKVGFKVVEFDRDDTAAVRTMGHLLEWDQGEDKQDLEHDLFATYTLVEKPR